jgi:hypothetical protein
MKRNIQPVKIKESIKLHAVTVEEQRQYQYFFDTHLGDAEMTAQGKHNWEAVCTMTREGQFGILYKKTV